MVTAHSKIQTAKTTSGLIDEVIARHQIGPIRDDDVTVWRMKEKTGWTRWRCIKVIRDEVEAGHLMKIIVLDHRGHEVTAYRRPVDTK
jgi:hypothetical protein